MKIFTNNNSLKKNASNSIKQGGAILKRLKKGEINEQEALNQLVDKDGVVNINLLDSDVNQRFLQYFRDCDQIPHVIPLLLWRGCFYLGSPARLTEEETQHISYRVDTNIKIIAITEKSYATWYRLQRIDPTKISEQNLVNPITGEELQENLEESTKVYLSQANSQIKKINALISSALSHRASDIHLEPHANGLRVRFRIDGILRPITTLSHEVSRQIIVSLKVMCDMDISESRVPQDGRIGEKYTTGEQQEQGLDLRVSTLPCVSNLKGKPEEKAVIRLLRQNNSFKTISDLGFSTQNQLIYEKYLAQPQGMIIFTGPTGSGKTTTLYTSLQVIAKDSVNVIIVENPVEYILPGITQTQVNEVAGMTFAAGMRAILRQDPDIIMLGEIRDSETSETAIRAALTGHLVLTTLHTNDAIGAIPRLKDLGTNPAFISDALLGVVAQRLVRKVCLYCAEHYYPTESDLRKLDLTLEEANPQAWKKGKGCEKCLQSGYLGREAVIEMLNFDQSVRQAIREYSIPELQQYLAETGFYSFRKAALDKVTTGITTVEEVQRVLPYNVLSKLTLPNNNLRYLTTVGNSAEKRKNTPTTTVTSTSS